MNAIYKGFSSLERWMNLLSAGLLVFMMLMVTASAFGRYAFNTPILGTLELTEELMVFIVYLGIAYTQFLKAHINIDLVLTRFSEKSKLVCEAISMLFAWVLFALITWQGSLAFIEAYEVRELTVGSVEIPLWPAKFMVPFGSLILCLRYIYDIVHNIQKLRGRGN